MLFFGSLELTQPEPGTGSFSSFQSGRGPTRSVQGFVGDGGGGKGGDGAQGGRAGGGPGGRRPGAQGRSASAQGLSNFFSFFFQRELGKCLAEISILFDVFDVGADGANLSLFELSVNWALLK